jgi:hypothetical protein
MDTRSLSCAPYSVAPNASRFKRGGFVGVKYFLRAAGRGWRHPNMADVYIGSLQMYPIELHSFDFR